MADNDQDNDEYQFADLDVMTPDAGDEGAAPEIPSSGEEPPPVRLRTQPDIKRNALIVIVLVVLIMLIYKLVGAIFSEKKAPVKTISNPAPVQVTAPQPVTVQPVITAAPPPAPLPSSTNDSQVNQKLSALEVGQQNMRTDVSSVSSQLGGINTNLNTLIAKINELDSMITSLNAKINQQAREIEQLTIRKTVKKAHYVHHRSTGAGGARYYIQAVIPGRAWLIATNGSTLTVREGTVIPGYGVVKLIDPNQGRVTTSSGQVIRFSQEDS